MPRLFCACCCCCCGGRCCCVCTSSGLSTALAESAASSSLVATFRSDNDQVGAGSTYGAEVAKPAIPFPSPFAAPFALSLPATLVAVVPSSRCWLRDLRVVTGTAMQAVRSVNGASWADNNLTVALSKRRRRQQARGIMVNARKAGSKCSSGRVRRRGPRGYITGLSEFIQPPSYFLPSLAQSLPLSNTAGWWTWHLRRRIRLGSSLGCLQQVSPPC